MPSSSRRAAIGTAVCVLLLAWLGWRALGVDRSRIVVGRPAPPLRGTRLDDQAIDPDRLRGRRLLVVFWASWTPLGAAQVKVLADLPPSPGSGEPWTVLGALPDGERDREGATSALSGLAVRFPHVLLGPDEATAWGGLGVLPTLCEIDASGRIRRWHEGFVDPATLLEWRRTP